MFYKSQGNKISVKQVKQIEIFQKFLVPIIHCALTALWGRRQLYGNGTSSMHSIMRKQDKTRAAWSALLCCSGEEHTQHSKFASSASSTQQEWANEDACNRPRGLTPTDTHLHTATLKKHAMTHHYNTIQMPQTIPIHSLIKDVIRH